MFASPAHASAGAANSGMMTFVGIVPWILIFGIMYLLLFRPQQQRMKQHRNMVAAVKKSDVAVTSGGLIGKVTKVTDSEVELEIAANVRVKVIKSMLSDVRPHGGKPATD